MAVFCEISQFTRNLCWNAIFSSPKSPNVPFLLVMPKPFSTIWTNFIPQDNGKVKCSKCVWESVPNATRLEKHWGKHVEDDEILPTEECESQPSPKKAKITAHLDHIFSQNEQERAQKRLVFATINNGWSHNSLQQTSFRLFCTSIRYLHPKQILITAYPSF